MRNWSTGSVVVFDAVTDERRLTDQRPRRSVLSWWLNHGGQVAAALAMCGVWLGYSGYRRLMMSTSDSLYLAVQLLVLNGGSAPGGRGTPLALNIGRFLAASALGSAVVLVLVRLGSSSADWLRASWTNGHRVVFGSSAAAQQFAKNARRERSDNRRISCDAVLIGRLGEATTADLRRDGVAVVEVSASRSLAKVLHGASDIVVAEADDVDALYAMARIGTIANDERIPVRVFLGSNAMANAFRARMTALMGDAPTTVMSLPEAAALRLTKQDLFPTLFQGNRAHIVVAGCGDMAAEVALATVVPWMVHSSSTTARRIVIDLVGGPDDIWPEQVAQRLVPDGRRDGQIDVRVRRRSTPNSPWVDEVRSCCAALEDRTSVFIVGLPDVDAIVVGAELGLDSTISQVVSVMERDSVPPDTREHEDNGAKTWKRVTVAELLADRDLLRTTTPERLTSALLQQMALWQRAQSDGVLRRLLAPHGGDPTFGSAMMFAAELLDLLARVGFTIKPSTRVVPPIEMPSSVVRLLTTELSTHFAEPDESSLIAVRVDLGRIVEELPGLFAGIGSDLIPPEG